MNNQDQPFDVSALIGKNSGGDFTITYASATTLTLGTYPDGSSVTADDIVALVQMTSGGSVVGTFTRDDRTMSMSGNTLTVSGASFAASDVFIVYTNVPRSGTTAPTVVTSGADGVSNTQNAETTSARGYGFNGTTWDRLRAGITAVTATLTGWLNTLPWAIYNTTPTTRTNGQGGPLEADADGSLITQMKRGATSTRTTVTPALTSAALIAANTNRKGLRVVHTAADPSQNIWIAAAATATSAIFFTKLQGSGEISLYDSAEWPYSGQYSIISDVASGTIQVYELT